MAFRQCNTGRQSTTISPLECLQASSSRSICGIPRALVRNRAPRSVGIVLTHSTASAVEQAEQPTAVVVGAGPAGSLAAWQLANRGMKVEVYDKAQIQSTSGSQAIGDRAYSIFVTARGMHALEVTGVQLEEDPPGCFQVLGGWQHRAGTPGGKVAEALKDGWVVNRGALAAKLVAHCRSSFPKQISFHFGASIVDLDVDQRVATFSRGDQPPIHAPYALLVAADGVRSVTRQLLENSVEELTFSQQDNSMSYKSVSTVLPDLPPEWGHHLHSFSSGSAAFILMMSPAPGGGMHLEGPLALPTEHFDTLRSSQDYAQLLTAKFEDMPPAMVQALAPLLQEAPIAPGGTSTRCSTLAAPHAILIGDAAHSVFPTLGQGAMAALEDATVLGEVMADMPSLAARVMEVLPSAYNDARLADAHAVVSLSESGFDGGKKKGQRSAVQVNNNFFSVCITASFLLNKAVPALFPPPALLQINTSTTGYAELQRRWRKQQQMISVFICVLAAVVSAWLIKLLKFAAPSVRAAMGV